MKQLTISFLVLHLLAAGARAQCAQWKPGFNRPGVDGQVITLLVHDDGGGPALYVGGSFANAGGFPASRIARWDGSSWSALASGVDGLVFALATYDDGTGAALYAGGAFANAGGGGASNVARWNGTSWSALGSGTDDRVRALATYDDGSGLALYAGGDFLTAGGSGASHVAKWNGVSWTPLGAGVNGTVEALCVHDDGTGPALYVGGSFTSAGGAAANNIARWNGSSWAPLARGFGSFGTSVRGLVVHDDGAGGGAQLYACGGCSWPSVLRWNGTSWASVGQGFDSPECPNDVCVHDDGGGPALYCAGVTLKRWNGSTWTLVGAGGNVAAIQSYGGALYAGGDFSSLFDTALSFIGRLSGSTWSPLGPGDGIEEFGIPPWIPSPSAAVNALHSHDDGSGAALYAGGTFAGAGNAQASSVARWNGTSWSALGAGMSSSTTTPNVSAFASSGPILYAGGSFTSAGGTNSRNVASWNGVSWSALGAGVDGGPVLALVQQGPLLFVAGAFDTAGGMPASRIASWNGAAWSALSAGTTNGAINALAVFDDGTGPALYAGGSFTQIQGVNANHIARWNGSSWSALGAGTNGVGVNALAVHDDGSGRRLYAAGNFTLAGGASANNVAKWDGANWSALGSGASATVTALAVHDDGVGPALYATQATSSLPTLVRWNGTTWSTLDGAFDNGSFLSTTYVNALASHDDNTGGGASLYVGGDFWSAGNVPSNDIAQWRTCAAGVPYCAGDGSGTACPCGNASALGANEGCPSSIGLGGRLRAIGGASLASDTAHLLGSQMPNSTCLYIQGTTQTAAGAGAIFGDGLRCVGGSVVRLATKTNVGGASRYPDAGDVPLSIRGMVTAPGVRDYQVWYRNAATFCTADTFNLTNGMQMTWGP